MWNVEGSIAKIIHSFICAYSPVSTSIARHSVGLLDSNKINTVPSSQTKQDAHSASQDVRFEA